jgi:hypothetical protein
MLTIIFVDRISPSLPDRDLEMRWTHGYSKGEAVDDTADCSMEAGYLHPIPNSDARNRETLFGIPFGVLVIDAQSRVVSLLLDKNEEKTSTEAYRTVTELQNSGGDLQVVDKVGVPDGI